MADYHHGCCVLLCSCCVVFCSVCVLTHHRDPPAPHCELHRPSHFLSPCCRTHHLILFHLCLVSSTSDHIFWKFHISSYSFYFLQTLLFCTHSWNDGKNIFLSFLLCLSVLRRNHPRTARRSCSPQPMAHQVGDDTTSTIFHIDSFFCIEALSHAHIHACCVLKPSTPVRFLS